MKEAVNFLGRRYSAVSSDDICEIAKKSGKYRKSAKKCSILDSFFHEREPGKLVARWPKCVFLLLTAGLCLLSTSIFIYLVQPYDLIFKWKLMFSDDGEIFNMWKTPPVDLYIKIYIYNITNSEQFIKGTEKMNIEEIGPYVYREVFSHQNITFNDNGTVSTTPKHPLEWQEHLSEGRREDDIFMMPNIALLSIAQVASPKSYFLRLPINLVIRNTNSQPIVKTTAREFMFGYESPLTTLGNKLLPNWIYFEKVGLIDRMYDFDGDFETFFTGEHDSSMGGLYDTFRGSPNLTQWDGSHCSNIQGASDGTKFKSFIKENETLLFFRKSMCRPQRINRVGNKSTIQGLDAVTYKFEENALDNGIYEEKNKCFCRDGKCLPAGLVDVTSCYYGFPIALSYPHFLDSDPKLVENITGSFPNRSKHESFFVINPTSGLPLQLSVRFQINLAMHDVSNMAHVEQFSNIVIPMVWFEIGMYKLPESLKNRFTLYLNILPVLEKIGLYGCLICGTVLTIFAITRAALRLSTSFTASKNISSNHHKYNSNLKNSAIYNACETQEKLMSGDSCKPITATNLIEPEEMLTIGRCDFDLENELALSDIDYDDDEMSDEHSSTNSINHKIKDTSHKKLEMAKDNSFSNASTSSEFDLIRRPSLIDADVELLNESPSTIINVQLQHKDDSTMLRIVESNEEVNLA